MMDESVELVVELVAANLRPNVDTMLKAVEAFMVTERPSSKEQRKTFLEKPQSSG